MSWRFIKLCFWLQHVGEGGQEEGLDRQRMSCTIISVDYNHFVLFREEVILLFWSSVILSFLSSFLQALG